MLLARDIMDDFVAAGGNGQSCDPAAKKWKLAAVLIVTSSGLNLIRFLVVMANIYIVMKPSCYLATVKLSKVVQRPDFVFESC